VQVAYSATIAATGGTPPYSWSIASGSLPTGLLLASSGQISGIPTQAGSSSFTAQVQDSKNSTATQAVSISIATTSGPSTQALSLVISGTGINQIATVESSNQFRLVFEAADNWGLSQWYDLVNDPNATVNLAGPNYSVNGPSNPCAAEPGLQNMVFYGDNDAKLDMREAGCAFSGSARSMNVLSSSPSLVVIQTSGHPMNGLPNIDTNITGTNTYYILPNGQIYVHNTVSVASAKDLSNGGTADLFISTMELEDPTQQGTIPPDSQGWIRASATQNPYSYVGSQENYVFAYWGPNTPSPYTNYTKASIMLVPSPNNPTTLSQIVHSWSSGPGYGVVRWGYRMSPGPNMLAGQTIAYDFLLQLGTQGSSVLPNINSSAVADPIATSYRANPIPPAVTGTPVAITVSPSNSTVKVGSTQQFVGNVTGTSNTAVTWTVSGASCTGAACGTVSVNGLYVSPASVPSSAVVTVTATSVAEPTKSASANVTIVAAIAVLLSISPASASVPSSGTQLFTASVTGTSNTSVGWAVSGPGCSGSSCGSLSTNGSLAVYSAPTALPSPASVNVLATSMADPTESASAAVTLVTFALQIASGGLPNGQPGVPFQATLTGTGGVTPYKWTVTGALPSGLTLDALSGTIAGTPTQSGTSTFTIVLTDSTGQTAQQPSSITIAAAGSSGQVTITPAAPPAVNQGQTTIFTCSVLGGGGCTWTCPGCAGSINASTGVYTAPATVNSAESFGGYQLLPNDHIYNTRIDSLPVDSNSSIWVSGAGTTPLNYLPSFPFNYVNNSSPTQSETFLYTPNNNGTFQIPGYPIEKIESGWFTSVNAPYTGGDHHLWTIDTTNGMFQELYDPSTPAQCNAYAGGSPNCTALSGLRYSNSTYALPSGNSTDAAGLYIMPLSLHLQELLNAIKTSGTINHAIRFTLQNGYIKFNSFIWPATSSSLAGGGVVPFGARFRLKSTFNTSSFSPIAQILLTQLKQYGIILADGGYGWQATIDAAKWPANVVSALNEIGLAAIAPSNFEAVDESGLMLSSSSGATPRSETVVATSISFPTETASQQVVLTGVTLGLDRDFLYAQAGASAIQINAYVHGSSNTSVTWSMSSSVGTLSSSGLYTPPATSASEQTTTITATSAANSGAVATIPVTIFPSGTIRIVNGKTTNYTDTNGNVWLAGGTCCGGDDGGYPSGNTYGGSWPSVPNITLYEVPWYSSGGDLRFDIYVPNGNYQVLGKFVAARVNGPGLEVEGLETQGNLVYSNLDFYALAGYLQPIDFTLPATITNGQLSFVVRNMGSGYPGPDISAIQIAPVP
jgi:hypothetical protein